MLDLYFTNQFKKDYRKVSKSGEITLLDEVIDLLRQGLSLPEKFRDHALIDSKKFKSQRECHIKPDWLLVYSVNNEKLVLTLTRTGSHSELFGVVDACISWLSLLESVEGAKNATEIIDIAIAKSVYYFNM